MKKQMLPIMMIVLFVSTTVSAQKHFFKVDAGINISTIHSYHIIEGEGGEEINPGYQIGFKFGYNLPSQFHIQLGLDLNGNISRSAATGFSNPPVHSKNKLGVNIEFPVHFGYKINITDYTKLLFQIGPYLAYRIGGGREITYESLNDSTPERYEIVDGRKRFDFGAGVNVGIEFKQWGVNFGADFGFRNISKNHGIMPIKRYNDNLALTVGYKF